MTWAFAFIFLRRLPRPGGGRAAGQAAHVRERLA